MSTILSETWNLLRSPVHVGLAFVLFAAPVGAAVVINEYTIPTAASGPDGISSGPDGNLWFVEYSGNKVGRITTAGVITEFAFPTAGSGPDSITSGPDGNLWFTEFAANKTGRITTEGVFAEFPIPTANGRAHGVAPGPDGNVWFTEYLGDKIGRITATGVITEFPIPTAGARPTAIAPGPDGNLWFTEYTGNKIGRLVTPGTSFFPVTPCRLFDTRHDSGPDAASPILAAGESRALALDGRCGVPVSAGAIAFNVTATESGASGTFVLFRGDLPSVPETSDLSFAAGRTRASNGILALDFHGGRTIKVLNGSVGSTHFILDVAGYFE